MYLENENNKLSFVKTAAKAQDYILNLLLTG